MMMQKKFAGIIGLITTRQEEVNILSSRKQIIESIPNNNNRLDAELLVL